MATAQITAILIAAVFLTAFYDGGRGGGGGGGGGVLAQSPAPAPSSTDCFETLLNMSDCLTFVETGSNLTVPEKPCCGELAGLVESNPLCLCQLLGNTNSFGIPIDVKRALKLPTICKVDTPPVSTCALLGFPVGGLTPSEAPTPGVQPPGTDGGDVQPPGTNGTPPPGNKNNGVSSMVDSSLACVVGLAIAFIPSLFF